MLSAESWDSGPVPAGRGRGLRRVSEYTAFVVIADPSLRASVVGALRGALAVLELRSIAEVPVDKTRREKCVILVGGAEISRMAGCQQLAAFRDSDDWSSVIACSELGAKSIAHLPPAVRAGLDSIAFCSGSTWQALLCAQVTGCLDHNLGAEITQRVLGETRGIMRARLAYLLRRAYRRISVGSLAERLGVSGKVLRDQFARCGLASTIKWIEFAMLTHVSHQLDGTRSTLGVIARRLGFADESTMSHMVHRLTGMSPTALRDRGAVSTVLEVIDRSKGGRDR